MKCTRCGAENAPGAVYCTNCRSQLYVNPTPIPAYMPGYMPAPVVPGKALGIASMVLGILSLVLFCFWFFAIPCALVGCILGAISMTQAKNAHMKANSMSVAGLVCSIIALAVAVFYIIFAVIVASSSPYYYFFRYF